MNEMTQSAPGRPYLPAYEESFLTASELRWLAGRALRGLVGGAALVLAMTVFGAGLASLGLVCRMIALAASACGS